jgi:hypothetical protein
MAGRAEAPVGADTKGHDARVGIRWLATMPSTAS